MKLKEAKTLKRGDLVLCTSLKYRVHLTIGKIYEVLDYFEEPWVSVIGDNGIKDGHYYHNFTLINIPAIKILYGDE